MKKVLFSAFLMMFVITASAQNGKPKATVKTPVKTIVKTTPPAIKDLLDSFSYMAGYNVASNMRDQGITNLNTALMQKGVEDLFNNNPMLIPMETGNKSLQSQLAIFSQKKAEIEKQKVNAEKAKCLSFLDNNKKRKEVTTLPDGLQYEIIKPGDAAANKPHVTDTVVVNYIGVLIDGKEFDNSVKRGQPAVFPVDKVIKGWTEILQLMTVGAHWKVYIPTELAYNDNPPPGSNIPPGSALIFDIMLEGIKPVVEKAKQ